MAMANISFKKTIWFAVLFGVLAAMLISGVYAFRTARQAAMHHQQANNLKQVGLGVMSFNQNFGRLPHAVNKDKSGRPLSSWRFRVLPFLEAIMMDVDYDARWDDDTNEFNRQFINTELFVYCCPWAKKTSGKSNTNIVAITGPGTAFDDDRDVRVEDLPPDTALLIEIADSGTHWMAPGDLDVRNVPASITQGILGGGVHVLFADGSVWFFRPDTPLEELKKFFTIEGAKQYDREKVLGRYALKK
jgi:prepilin-type processing-associated H-X9-DG protein